MNIIFHEFLFIQFLLWSVSHFWLVLVWPELAKLKDNDAGTCFSCPVRWKTGGLVRIFKKGGNVFAIRPTSSAAGRQVPRVCQCVCVCGTVCVCVCVCVALCVCVCVYVHF